MIKELYETTELTLQQIADSVEGATYKIVWSRVHRWYAKDIRDNRKRICYRNSKLGDKNPMFGKMLADHHNYIDECSDGYGYLTIVKPEWYTGRRGSKRVFKHSIVMCEHLGISEIPQGFVIHHIDYDRVNNDLINLALMTISAHTRLHQLERATTREKSRRVQEDSKRTAPTCNHDGSRHYLFKHEYCSICGAALWLKGDDIV